MRLLPFGTFSCARRVENSVQPFIQVCTCLPPSAAGPGLPCGTSTHVSRHASQPASRSFTVLRAPRRPIGVWVWSLSTCWYGRERSAHDGRRSDSRAACIGLCTVHLRTLRLVAGLVYLRLVRLATAAGSKLVRSCLHLSTLTPMRDGAMEVAAHVAGCMHGCKAGPASVAGLGGLAGWLPGWMLDSVYAHGRTCG